MVNSAHFSMSLHRYMTMFLCITQFTTLFMVASTEMLSEYFISVGNLEGLSLTDGAKTKNDTSMFSCGKYCLLTEKCPGFSTRRSFGRLDCMFSLEKKDLTTDNWSLYSIGLTPRPNLCGDDPDSVPFLRRLDGSEDFFRGWADYKAGFGDDKAEFWLGLDTLHSLTSSASYGLKVSMVAWNGDVFCSRYSNFAVGPEADGYRLSVSGYDTSSTGGDSLTDPIESQNGMKFSTKDMDNDARYGSCSLIYKGSWWYRACHRSNPTGVYMVGGNAGLSTPQSASGVDWRSAYGFHYSFKYMELSITPNL